MKNIVFLFSIIISLSGSLQAAELVAGLEPIFQLPCNQGLVHQLERASQVNNAPESFRLIRTMLNNALESRASINDDTKTAIIQALEAGTFEISRN
jgi:hypothetical protein